MTTKTVLAIDPGSAKCGMALVRRETDDKLTIVWRRIPKVEELPAALNEAMALERFNMVVVGSGTKSQSVVGVVRETFPSIGILVIDERETTLQARERYWEHNQRRGWRKLMPASMQVPPEPYDDFVAFILAERVLQVE